MCHQIPSGGFFMTSGFNKKYVYIILGVGIICGVAGLLGMNWIIGIVLCITAILTFGNFVKKPNKAHAGSSRRWIASPLFLAIGLGIAGIGTLIGGKDLLSALIPGIASCFILVAILLGRKK